MAVGIAQQGDAAMEKTGWPGRYAFIVRRFSQAPLLFQLPLILVHREFYLDPYFQRYRLLI